MSRKEQRKEGLPDRRYTNHDTKCRPQMIENASCRNSFYKKFLVSRNFESEQISLKEEEWCWVGLKFSN